MARPKSTSASWKPAVTGHTSKEIKIIRTKEFTPAQMNDMCATCHAKLVPLSLSFLPGDKFFDHFDLITLEHADFYPDGRDLGENYTLDLVADEPVHQVGQAGLQPLPHAQRPAAFRGREVEPDVHALPREGGASSRRSTAITRPGARGTSASPATCP